MSSSSGRVVKKDRRNRGLAVLAVGAHIRILLGDARKNGISGRELCGGVALIIGYARMSILIGILHGAN